MTVESTYKRGSTFSVILPRIDSAEAARLKQAEPQPAPTTPVVQPQPPTVVTQQPTSPVQQSAMPQPSTTAATPRAAKMSYNTVQ